jgi:hypothetical protein
MDEILRAGRILQIEVGPRGEERVERLKIRRFRILVTTSDVCPQTQARTQRQVAKGVVSR